jgi:hypothetical protein
MLRDLVSSSNVQSIGYDEASQTLEVEFQKSGVYQYYNVPLHIYEQLMMAPSKGRFLNAYIVRGYPYSRVG